MKAEIQAIKTCLRDYQRMGEGNGYIGNFDVKDHIDTLNKLEKDLTNANQDSLTLKAIELAHRTGIKYINLGNGWLVKEKGKKTQPILDWYADQLEQEGK